MTVPAADGKMRFWRNTSVATQAAGATATLDRGHRRLRMGRGRRQRLPAGRPDRPVHRRTPPACRSCRTTGNTFGTGNAVHHLTLYRAPSGALVFGAGTVQWAWGLDSHHDNGSAAAEHVDAAGDGEPVRRHGRPAGHPAVAGSPPRPRRPTRRHPTAAITSPAAGATVQAGSAVGDLGHRHRHRRRRRRRGRGLDRRRHHLAPGVRARHAGRTRGRRVPPAPRRSRPAPPTTAGTSARRRP